MPPSKAHILGVRATVSGVSLGGSGNFSEGNAWLDKVGHRDVSL